MKNALQDIENQVFIIAVQGTVKWFFLAALGLGTQ